MPSAFMHGFFSWTLSVIPLGLLLALAVTGPLFSERPLVNLLQILALLLASWALLSMGRKTFSVLPGVRAGATLVKRGPYRWVRHPMYTAVTFLALSWLVLLPTWPRVLCGAVLFLTLFLKSRYEERQLARVFPGYPSYRASTRAFLPYLF